MSLNKGTWSQNRENGIGHNIGEIVIKREHTWSQN